MRAMITIISIVILTFVWLLMVHKNRINSTGYNVVLCFISAGISSLFPKVGVPVQIIFWVVIFIVLYWGAKIYIRRKQNGPNPDA